MHPDQRVLLVDDEEDVLESVSSYLSDRGYRVVTASKWTEAIAQLQEAKPDIVLLDLNLPTVRGPALLEFIRESYSDLPVVIVSSDIDTATLDKLSSLGASGFVRKPFDTEDLLVVVEQALLDQPADISIDPDGVPEESEPSEEGDTEPAQSASTPRDAAVMPGSGVETLEKSRHTPGQQTRRRLKKRRGGRRGRRFRTYVIAFVLCVLIGVLLWALSDTLSSGFFGIGIR